MFHLLLLLSIASNIVILFNSFQHKIMKKELTRYVNDNCRIINIFIMRIKKYNSKMKKQCVYKKI